MIFELFASYLKHYRKGGLVPKSGAYETIYGNACEYYDGDDTAEDLDMRETIVLEMVDFTKFIRELD